MLYRVSWNNCGTLPLYCSILLTFGTIRFFKTQWIQWRFWVIPFDRTWREDSNKLLFYNFGQLGVKLWSKYLQIWGKLRISSNLEISKILLNYGDFWVLSNGITQNPHCIHWVSKNRIVRKVTKSRHYNGNVPLGLEL